MANNLLETDSIAEFLKELRLVRNLSQGDLGEKIGMDRRNVAAYEADKSKKPKSLVKALLSTNLLAGEEKSKLIALYGAAAIEELLEEIGK